MRSPARCSGMPSSAAAARERRATPIVAPVAACSETITAGSRGDELAAPVRVDKHGDDESRTGSTGSASSSRLQPDARRLANASYDGFFFPSMLSSPDCQPPIDGLSLSRNQVKRSIRGFALAMLYACLTYAACFAQ